jgi:hypothetical protein
MVTASGVATETTVAANVARDAPDGTVNAAGTVTAELLLDRIIVKPPVEAAAVKFTVQASEPAPVIDALLQESELNAAGAGVPVPLRLTTAVPLVEESLAIVRRPVAAPVAVGANCTVKVSAWPGFNVAGNEAPESVKPVPVSAAASTVTAALPVEVKVIDCVAGVLTWTLPKGTLAALRLSAGNPTFSCRAKAAETLPRLAVIITGCGVATEATFAVNVALNAPAGTVTVAGNVAAALLLDRATLTPPLGATAPNVTSQPSVPGPVMDALRQATESNGGVPVPLRLITSVPLVKESLTIVS